MNDLISRQAAIDRIQGTGYADAIKNNLMLILRLLPSAQPEQRWIPCSERLPEYGQFVLVSINGSVGCDVLMHCNKGIIWHYDGNLVLDSDAWQPLPEAYQEG